MATYLHFAPALALAVAMGPRRIPTRLMLAGAFCAVLPDADFALVALGFDTYIGTYGHRGFSHSPGFALLLGALAAVASGPSARKRCTAAVFVTLCAVSHPLFDGLIDSGICNAWAWPLDGARHCLPWRPVPMDGVGLFGWERLTREAIWFGVPLLLLANAGMWLRYSWQHGPGLPRPAHVPRQPQRAMAREMHAIAMAPAVAAARASGGWAGSNRAARTRRRAAMQAVGAVLRPALYGRGTG